MALFSREYRRESDEFPTFWRCSVISGVPVTAEHTQHVVSLSSRFGTSIVYVQQRRSWDPDWPGSEGVRPRSFRVNPAQYVTILHFPQCLSVKIRALRSEEGS